MKKTILVTGASGNLGMACVKQFVADGHRILATVSPGKKSSFEKMRQVDAYEADLSSEDSVNSAVGKMYAEHPVIDAAVLLVGGFSRGSVSTTDGTEIRKMISLNFETAYYVARPVFQMMCQQPHGGRIIFIGAKPAITPAEGTGEVAYALSKSMIFRLAELLNADAKGRNVVSSVIVPGTMDTPANRAALPHADYSTWVTPADIAASMAYLISDESKSLCDPVFKMYGNS